jgi:MscS family membrane protein
LQEVEGKVERIGLRSTRMRSLEGHFVTIPNKTMTSAIITNITRRPNIQKAFTFSLPYHSTSEKVRRAVSILEDVYRKHALVEDVVIGFSEFADSSLLIKVTLFCKDTDGKTLTAAMHEMNMSIKQRFDKDSIELAFPTRMTLVKQMGG